MYYNNQTRWAYTFQNCATLSRYKSIEETITRRLSRSNSKTRQVFVTERCLYSDFEVFTKMLYEDKKIDNLEYTLYEKWLKQLLKSSTSLSGVVYLNTPPEVCYRNVKKRNREGEEDMSLKYLQEVGRYQNKWVNDLSATVPTLQIDVKSTLPCDVMCSIDKFVQSVL